MLSLYLSGFLLGKRVLSKKVSKAVLDTGLFSSISGSRIYACLKGFVDAGVEVPHDESVLPGEDRVRGKHISAYALALKEQGKLEKQFSQCLKAGCDPAKIDGLFDQVLEKIKGEFK